MRSILETLEQVHTWIEDQLLASTNPLFFGLRRRLAFRRSGYTESRSLRGPRRTRNGHPLVAWLESGEAKTTRERYRLARYEGDLTPSTLAAVARFAFLLDEIATRSRLLTDSSFAAGPCLDVLDVGSKNFEYAPAIVEWASTHWAAAPVRLTGIEIDAYRIYRGFYSRCDVANYYLSLLTGEHRYLAQDAFDHTDTYDLILWSKPFLTSYPLLRWGLPRRLLRPQRLLRHVLGRLRPRGRLIIMNQNEDESDVQATLLNAAGVAAECFTIFDPLRGEGAPIWVHIVRSFSAAEETAAEETAAEETAEHDTHADNVASSSHRAFPAAGR